MSFFNTAPPLIRRKYSHSALALFFSTTLMIPITLQAADLTSTDTKEASNTSATSLSALSAEQKDEIGEIAANWLVAHPEYLIAASESLRQQQQVSNQQTQRSLAQQNREELLADNPPSSGAKDAKATVVIFFDYLSNEYRQFYPTIEKLRLNNPNVHFVYRAITELSQNKVLSTYAAQVGEEIWLNKGSEPYLQYQHSLMDTATSQEITAENISKAGSILDNPEQLKKLAANSLPMQVRFDTNHLIADKIALKHNPSIIVLPQDATQGEDLSVLTWPISEESLSQSILKAIKK